MLFFTLSFQFRTAYIVLDTLKIVFIYYSKCKRNIPAYKYVYHTLLILSYDGAENNFSGYDKSIVQMKFPHPTLLPYNTYALSTIMAIVWERSLFFLFMPWHSRSKT